MSAEVVGTDCIVVVMVVVVAAAGTAAAVAVASAVVVRRTGTAVLHRHPFVAVGESQVSLGRYSSRTLAEQVEQMQAAAPGVVPMQVQRTDRTGCQKPSLFANN